MNFLLQQRLLKNVLPSIHNYEKRIFEPLNKIYYLRLSSSGKGTYRPTTFDKYCLVWMKKYPSVADVPVTVSKDMMEKTRNWVRIKMTILLCIITGVVCIAMIYSGKEAAKRGENLHQKNIKWHADLNEKK